VSPLEKATKSAIKKLTNSFGRIKMKERRKEIYSPAATI
jgi:hypothetical protein